MSQTIPVFNANRASIAPDPTGAEATSSDSMSHSSFLLSGKDAESPSIAFKNESLVIGIKRNLARYTQQVIDSAQAAYRALRTKQLESFGYKCHYCGVRSKTNGLTHLDGNHHNNQDNNTVCACPLCHAYHHVGQESLEAAKPGLAEAQMGGNKQMIMIRAPVTPNLSAQDFNHLQRAIALALTDTNEAPAAMKVLTSLVSQDIRRDMQESFVSAWPSDIGLAMSKLTEDEYKKSRYILRDVRAIYSPEVLKPFGRIWSKEQPAFADPAQWAQLMAKTMDLLDDQDQGVGVESVLDSAGGTQSSLTEGSDHGEDEDEDEDD